MKNNSDGHSKTHSINPHDVITPPLTLDMGLDDCQVFYLETRLVTALFLCPIICLFGLLGNVMSIVVLRTLKMRISTKTYLVGMAMSDATKLMNDSFYFIVILITHFDAEVGHACYSHLYPYAHFLFNASSCMTAWLTVSVAYERFILVCYPTVSRISCSAYRARITTIVVFAVSTLISLPFLFRYRTILHYGWVDNEVQPSSTYQQLLFTPSETAPHLEVYAHSYTVNVTDFWRENQSLVEVYNWLHGSIRSLIPLLILCVLTYLIVRASRRTRSMFKRTLSAKQRVTLTLVSVIVLFLICVSPDAVLSTFFGFGYHEESYCVKGVREITDLLLTLNSASNFVLYCVFNRGFRKTLGSTTNRHCNIIRGFIVSYPCCKKCLKSGNISLRGCHDQLDSRNTTFRPTSMEYGGVMVDKQESDLQMKIVNHKRVLVVSTTNNKFTSIDNKTCAVTYQ